MCLLHSLWWHLQPGILQPLLQGPLTEEQLQDLVDQLIQVEILVSIPSDDSFMKKFQKVALTAGALTIVPVCISTTCLYPPAPHSFIHQTPVHTKRGFRHSRESVLLLRPLRLVESVSANPALFSAEL